MPRVCLGLRCLCPMPSGQADASRIEDECMVNCDGRWASDCNRQFDRVQAAVSEGTVAGTEPSDRGLVRMIVVF